MPTHTTTCLLADRRIGPKASSLYVAIVDAISSVGPETKVPRVRFGLGSRFVYEVGWVWSET